MAKTLLYKIELEKLNCNLYKLFTNVGNKTNKYVLYWYSLVTSKNKLA